MRELCVWLSYASREDAPRLGEVHLEYGGARDPVELFQSSSGAPNMSRFELLFHSEDPGAESVRRSFFLNGMYNAATVASRNMSQRLDEFMLQCIARDECQGADILQGVAIAVALPEGMEFLRPRTLVRKKHLW